MPPLGSDRPFVAPKVETAKLPNGLELFVVERRDLPKVNVTLVTRAGAVGDPAGKAGVGNLAIRVIDLGTTTRKALEIEACPWRSGHDTDRRRRSRERAVESRRAVAQPLAGAGILADVVQNPSFPKRRSRVNASACSTRSRRRIAAATRSTRRIQPMLAFGPDHPYGRPTQGLKGSVEGITRADLVAFHQARVKPGSHGHRAGGRHLADAGHLSS